MKTSPDNKQRPTKTHLDPDLPEPQKEKTSHKSSDAKSVPTKPASDPEETEKRAKEGYREEQPLSGKDKGKGDPDPIRDAD